MFNYPHVAMVLPSATNMGIAAISALNVLREIDSRWHVEASYSTVDNVALLFAFLPPKEDQ